MKSPSRVRLFVTPWTGAYQASPSMGFFRQEYWNGLPFPSPKLAKGMYIIWKFLLYLVYRTSFLPQQRKYCVYHKVFFGNHLWLAEKCPHSQQKKKKVYVLIPGICDLMWQESICRCDFEMGRGPRLPSQAQCKQQRSFKRGAGGVREGGERSGSRNGVNW